MKATRPAQLDQLRTARIRARHDFKAGDRLPGCEAERQEIAALGPMPPVRTLAPDEPGRRVGR